MMNRPKNRDATGEPIYGTVAGDEPPPPPPTKFAYYVQLNTRHCISLHRAVHLFKSLSNRSHHRIECYFSIFADLATLPLYNLSRILCITWRKSSHVRIFGRYTRNWIQTTCNLLSSYAISFAGTSQCQCSTAAEIYIYISLHTNGVNFAGSPEELPCTPRETWEQTY